jgi:hypothetical protein
MRSIVSFNTLILLLRSRECYVWKKNPATAVNAFLRLVHGDYTLLHVGHQLAIRKTVSIATYTDH